MTYCNTCENKDRAYLMAFQTSSCINCYDKIVRSVFITNKYCKSCSDNLNRCEECGKKLNVIQFPK